MKTIENKKLVIEGRDTTYRDLIIICLNNPPPKEGFSREEFKARDRIEAALTAKEDGLFHLEDADYTKLKQVVASMRWIVRDPQLTEFLDYIEQDRELVKPK